MSDKCPFCGSGFSGPLCDESTNNETMGSFACGSFFRPNMTNGESIFDGIGKANVARSKVCELQSHLAAARQENAKLREAIADREQAAQFFRSALCEEISFLELHAFTWHERWPWLDDDSTEQQPATVEQGEWKSV